MIPCLRISRNVVYLWNKLNEHFMLSSVEYLGHKISSAGPCSKMCLLQHLNPKGTSPWPVRLWHIPLRHGSRPIPWNGQWRGQTNCIIYYIYLHLSLPPKRFTPNSKRRTWLLLRKSTITSQALLSDHSPSEYFFKQSRATTVTTLASAGTPRLSAYDYIIQLRFWCLTTYQHSPVQN